MTNTLRFDAGASGNPHLAADNEPDLTGDSSLYLTFKVVSAPSDFDERSVFCIDSRDFQLHTYLGNLVAYTDVDGIVTTVTGITSYGWIHTALITASGVTTLRIIEEGFNAGSPSYLFNGTLDPGDYAGPHVVNGRDFSFGIFHSSDACHLYGHLIQYEAAHTEAEMLSQFASRAAVHASPHTSLIFTSTSTPGIDQSGNVNDWTAVNTDGLASVADEPSDWATPAVPTLILESTGRRMLRASAIYRM